MEASAACPRRPGSLAAGGPYGHCHRIAVARSYIDREAHHRGPVPSDTGLEGSRRDHDRRRLSRPDIPETAEHALLRRAPSADQTAPVRRCGRQHHDAAVELSVEHRDGASPWSPRLRTTIVYSTRSPTMTADGLTDFSSARSTSPSLEMSLQSRARSAEARAVSTSPPLETVQVTFCETGTSRTANANSTIPGLKTTG